MILLCWVGMGWRSLRLGIGFREGLVGGGRGPANNYQEDIEDEECDGDVVEDRSLMWFGQNWLADQKRKAAASRIALSHS